MATRILILGAAGGVGGELVRSVASPGFSLEPSYPGPYESVSLRRADLDVSKREDVARAVERERPNVIFNATGLSDVDLCEFYKWKAFLVNRDAAEHLARAAHRHEALVVNFSTDFVFDGNKGAPYLEEDPPNPLNVFGASKLSGELATMTHAKRHLIVRTGWLFSAGPGSHLIQRLRDWLKTQTTIHCYDEHERQPTLVHDFTNAVLQLVARGCNGIYNVSGRASATEYEVASEVVRRLGRTEVQIKPTQEGGGQRAAMRPASTVLNCSKMEQLGIKVRAWEESLGEALKN